MMMQMPFYWEKSVTIICDDWTTSTWPAYLMSLLAIFLFSVLYAYLDSRFNFKKRRPREPQISASSIESPLLPQLIQYVKDRAMWVDAMLDAVGYEMRTALLFAVFSYNGGVFLAVVLGFVFGYNVFRSQGMEVIEREANPRACV